MTYKIESLNCPNCGAPLDIKPNEDITFCLYCDSSIRISKQEGTEEKSVVHTEIPNEIIEEVKKLILSGDKAKATELYQNAANVSKEEASKQIEAFTASITNKIILKRPLSTKGILISTLFFLILISSVYILASGIANTTFTKIVCWVMISFMSLNLLSIMQSILLTIKYSSKKWNDATILKYYFISQKKKLSFFKVLLEVKEPNGSTFRTETKIMIKTTDIAKLQEGKTISVKYFPEEKDNVVASIGKLLK